MNREITETPQKGYYLVYLFREDMSGVYLSLNQGMTEIKNQNGSHKTKEILRSKTSEFRGKLGEYPELLESIDLNAINPSSNSIFYEEGNVYAKYYDLENLPSDDIFIRDLRMFLDLYDTLVYGSRNDSKENNIWKISPGNPEEAKKYWPLYKEQGFIGIDWMDSTRDFREFKSIDDLNEALEEYYGKPKTTSAQGIWNFVHNVKIGDYIVANRGKKKILGIGIVKSDYIGPNDPDNPDLDKEYRHLRKVNWIITDEFEMNNENFFDIKTITQLNGNKWNEILIQYYKNTDFNLIKELFDEFNMNYLSKEIGKTHYDSYQKESELLNDYFDKIEDDPNVVENTDDPILNYIVPIKRPSVSTVGFKSFKAFGYTDEQIPGLTKAIVNLISNLANNSDEEEQKNIIKSFKSGEYSKGSQAGVISPLVHGLNHEFLIINNKTVNTVNFLSKIVDADIKINGDLLSYINNNDKLKKFLSILSEEASELSDFHVFDAFCHWLCDNSLAGYATGSPLPILDTGMQNPPEIIDVDNKSFIKFLNSKGYYFEPELIENFLLSLKIKPFVILTGNSGTGKTKIAQLFAQYLDNSEKLPSTNSLLTDVMVGQSASSGGWGLKRKEFYKYYPELEKYEKEYNIKLDGIQSKGNLYIFPQIFYDSSNTKIKTRLKQIARNNPKKRIKLEIFDNNGTHSKNDGLNYKIVPVGANWTENRHIIGFFNVITEKYQRTEALNLILKSQNDPINPHFLILDEMNLSHVERYFSDFLSAMESGEAIRLHLSKDIKDVPNKIKFSDNLFVIGTVNIDETTYMFSPKVLDRANTIEFLTPSAKGYMNGNGQQNKPLENIGYLENPLSDIKIRMASIAELNQLLGEVETPEGKFWDLISDELDEFQIILKKAGFDFGFRVINEIMRFMYVSWAYERKPDKWDNWERYFDAQIKQKMLPRIHGSQRTLENVLDELSTKCQNYPTSKIKLEEMKKTLYKQRYVSFTN